MTRFKKTAALLTVFFCVSPASASTICEEADALLFPFRPNTPFFDLYTTLHDLETGQSRFDASKAAVWAAELSKDFSDESLQKFVLQRYAKTAANWAKTTNVKYVEIDSSIIDVKINFKESENIIVQISSDGEISITSKFLQETLDFVVSKMKNADHSMERLLRHARTCRHIADFESATFALFDTRYADEIVNDIFVLVVLHELAHIVLRHFEFEAPDEMSECDASSYMEYTADYVAVESFLDMEDQMFRSQQDQVGVFAAMIEPTLFLEVLDHTFGANAPIDRAIQDAWGCVDSTEVRKSRMIEVFGELIDEYREMIDQANKSYANLCHQQRADWRTKLYCDARWDRRPR